MSLINFEIELDLRFSRNCVLLDDDDDDDNDNITGANFTITSTKLYVPVVTFSINDYITFLEKVKQELKRTVSWNKYTSEITT